MTTETKFNFVKFKAKFNTESIIYRIFMGFSIFVTLIIIYIINFCFNTEITSIGILLLCLIMPSILPSIFKIQKVDGILLTKLGNLAHVSMEYNNYESSTDRDMVMMFKKSAELLFSSNYLQKLKVNKVYIYTHSSLAKNVIRELYKKNDVRFLKENYNNAIQKGWVDINGHKVIIKFHKKRLENLFASRVSSDSTLNDKSDVLEDKKDYYKITIPVELFYTKKTKNILN